MGKLFSRVKSKFSRGEKFDPWMEPFPGYMQSGGYGAPYSGPYGPTYDPFPSYGYGYPGQMTSLETYTGIGYPGRGGGYRLGQGYNPMAGMSPWNYGNYYMGNTSMQMMPMMRPTGPYNQGPGIGPGNGGLPMLPMLPMMPMMPCLPSYYSMAATAPMMAAACPLPIACNPLVQSMYPISSFTAPSFMSPTSFMSTLNSGPLLYRPPDSFQFPNNVNMVMNIPFGMSNSLLSMPSFGGFAPQIGMNGSMVCSCSYCAPTISAPTVSFYPRPVSVPQPYPVPVPAPVPIPNIQQVPIPRQVNVVAPPIVAGQSFGPPIGTGNSLLPFGATFTQTNLGQTAVMGSKQTSTKESLFSNSSEAKSTVSRRSISSSMDFERRLKAQRIAASLANLGIEDSRIRSSHRTRKNKSRIHNREENRPSLSTKSKVNRSKSDLNQISSLSKLSQHNRSTLSLNENLLAGNKYRPRKTFSITEE